MNRYGSLKRDMVKKIPPMSKNKEEN